MDYLVHPEVSEEIDNREADPLTGNIIGAAIDVHRALGPGLLESVSAIAPIHEAQLLSYLKLYGTCARGLLINFNVKRLVEGIRRMKI
jgi:hypothetical protein